uniref:COP9 signalosome complex subunit 7 n=1 Tax=Salix viminalis TaxID=40686 RepID=A0A6N2K4X6_SALVM
MEIEEGQTKVIKQFVNKVSILETTSSLANLIAPHVSLFAFSDLLSLPNFLQPQGAEDSAYLDFLCLFAYGTWYDYKRNSCMLPKLSPNQFLKLKQLILSFNISQDLEIRSISAGTNVVESLIHVELSILVGVPMRQPLLATFRLATSDSVPPLIEEKIVWASTMCQSDMDHQQELQGRIYEAKKDINFKETVPAHLQSRKASIPMMCLQEIFQNQKRFIVR